MGIVSKRNIVNVCWQILKILKSTEMEKCQQYGMNKNYSSNQISGGEPLFCMFSKSFLFFKYKEHLNVKRKFMVTSQCDIQLRIKIEMFSIT
jgi:hypothetical protein